MKQNGLSPVINPKIKSITSIKTDLTKLISEAFVDDTSIYMDTSTNKINIKKINSWELCIRFTQF